MRKAVMMTLGAGLLATAAIQFPSSAPAFNLQPAAVGKGAIVEKTGIIMPLKTKPGKAAKKTQKKLKKK